MPIPTLTAVASTAGAVNLDPIIGADCVIVVGTKDALVSSTFGKHIEDAAAVDPTVLNAASLLIIDGVPGKRLITAPTGPLDRDIDDVRRVSDAVVAAMKRARAAGAKAPILILTSSIGNGGSPAYAHAVRVALAAALSALYVPLTVRKAKGAACEPVDKITFISLGEKGNDVVAMEDEAKVAMAIETGKRISRDIGGADPEAGAPAACASYIQEHLSGMRGVRVQVIEDNSTILKEYPLAHAVARCSLHVPRHHPRIVRLEYSPPDGVTPSRHVFLVGKGITYDTGGADVKTGGHMVGMSRDKCGAASSAGFVAAASVLGSAVRITALLGFVRNSIGSDAYVSDEIIASRAGVKVLVVNTDAEGRMVMADLLGQARELAAALPPSERSQAVIHTVATLTGHAVIACGPAYSIAVENGPARAREVGKALLAAGGAIADPFELSTLRREDYEFIAPKTPEYDVKQVNNMPSVATPRGHQFPAAFMVMASGLSAHGVDSASPLAYCHIDCAGSSVAPPFIDGVVTGSVVAALTTMYC